MKKKIAFDVDGTLIDFMDRPRYHIIDLMLFFMKQGWDVIIWSGGGIDYAEMWRRKLGFEETARVVEKCSEKVDIAVDDNALETKIAMRKAIDAKVIIKV